MPAMKWIKQGQIFCPQNHAEWMVSHAANPVVEPLEDGCLRVYFSCRDKDNRSSIGFFEFDPLQPDQILRVASQPLIGPGALGLFDDSGTVMGCLVTVGNTRYLYYLGWNLGVTVPWRNSIGLAISEGHDLAFRKYSRAPILDRSEVDPFSISYPWVLRDGSRWKMWYGSNLAWGTTQYDMAHVIKYAESDDGIHWERQDVVAIPLLSPAEYAISKPCVLKEQGIYKMWYAYRGPAYRVGYAESPDGIYWERKDAAAGINVSESGWDSEMIEYACVFDHAGQRYMLYNGNGYGKTGIGLAVLDG
jgi:predicted GH43/DUF377 family glycosyl hydrolase